MKTIDVNTIIDREKLSAIQWIVSLLVFLVFFCDGIDTGVVGFIAPALIDEWGITKSALTPVLGASLIGMSIGALVSGLIAEKLGRRKMLIGSLSIISMFTILSAFVTSPQELTVYRFITGIGLGIAMPNGSTLISEYVPKKFKSFFTGLAGCGFLLGVSAGGFLSAYFHWSDLLLLIGTFSIILMLVLIIKLPESTQFLIINHKNQQAVSILEKIHGQIIDAEIRLGDYAVDLNVSNTPLKDIFSKYLFGSLMLWISSFMSLIVFYLFTTWMPIILKSIGFEQQELSLMAALFPFGGVIGALIMCVFMDRINPTKVITLSYFCAVTLFVLLSFSHDNVALFSLLIFLIGGLLAGAQVTLFPLATLFYPTTCRAAGLSLMHSISRTGAIFGSMTGYLIFSFNLSLTSIFLILSIPTFLAFVCLSCKGYAEHIHQKKLKVTHAN